MQHGRRNDSWKGADSGIMQGLKLFEGAYGKKDVRFAQAMHNMAGFYFLQKSFARSQQYYKEALQVG